MARSDVDNALVGALTLIVFRIPTTQVAWIEERRYRLLENSATTKSESMTRCGPGKQLSVRAMELTSRPSREAANHIYQQLGFERRESNVYRYTLD